MKRVVAVICAYWQSRVVNIERIVSDLLNGTIKPDRIIILNNNKDLDLHINGADVVTSEFNSRTRGKLIAGLLDIADYYLFLDDDTSVGKRTLERFLEVAHEDSCYGYCGVSYAGGNGKRIYPKAIDVEIPTEYFLGCGLFVSYKALIRVLVLDGMVRLDSQWKHQGEDVLIGLANKATIIPMRDDELFIDLDWQKEAMSWGSDGVTKGWGDYLKMRDELTLYAIKKLQERKLEDWIHLAQL